ncbi:hypothetical protein MVEN_00921300 [Mycena venus]|uniref:Uncharacterized protein n=1 Tax=Mycena venus TaxID=2733690 RepID=A0A8H6YB74_9AGAR|nr:hypothetical protein MVEN_00921300 [Mycena venus]
MADSGVPTGTPQATDASTALHLEAEVNARLDSPIMTLRTAGGDSQSIDEPSVDPLDALLDIPLTGLRYQAEKTQYLTFSRSPSPTNTESEDEDSDLEYIPRLREWWHDADTATVGPDDPPLPPSTSSHSMVNQTIRSFKTRAAKAQEITNDRPNMTPLNELVASANAPASAPAAPAKKKKKTKAVSRSASSLSMSEVAPSDAELFNMVGLLPPVKGKELAADYRLRADENDRRLVAWLLELQKTVDDTKNAQLEHHKEVLRRLADLQLSSSSSSASLNLNITADISRLKQLMAESREALSKLTGCVNGLVDIPVTLSSLQRAVRALQNTPAALPQLQIAAPPLPTPSSTSAHTSGDRSASNTNTSKQGSSTKRLRAFSVPEEPAKRAKAGEDDGWNYDVYLFPVNPHFGPAGVIAKLAIKETGVSMDAYVSAVHPHGTPKSVVSIRFNDSSVATAFIDRISTNPPDGMEDIQAMTPSAYGKSREGDAKENTRKGGKEKKAW